MDENVDGRMGLLIRRGGWATSRTGGCNRRMCWIYNADKDDIVR